MSKLALAVCLAFGCAPFAEAQEKKEPTAAQKKQQERMKQCNEQAGAKKLEGEARKSFTSACLKGATPQQVRMKECNKQASDKKMTGRERQQFIGICLKG